MDGPKTRTHSSTSNNSVTEYANEGFENSEPHLEKVVSIQMKDGTISVENSLASVSIYNGQDTKNNQKLKDFSEISGTGETPDEFIPTGFRKMYLAALTVLMFAVCMGTAATYTATAVPSMKLPGSRVRPSESEGSWIGSLLAVGALLGGSAGGFFTNLLGRKGCLMYNGVPFVAGWLLIAFAQSTVEIYIGRLVTGFCTGIVSVATPMYLVEISTREIRGLLGASFQLFVVIGVLLIACLGSILPWDYLALSGGAMCLLAATLMLFMPESPRWLISKKMSEEAKKALTFLQGESFDSEAECQIIEDEIKSQPAGSVQLQEFKAPTAYKPFVLSIFLMFFQQFSGVNAVLFYTVDIFEGAHVSLDPKIATIIVSIVQVLATALSSVLMDRAGRRPLLIISGACMAVSLLIFGGYDFAKTEDPTVTNNYGWLPVVCLTGFIAAFSIGFGPTPWLMVAEMNPARFKSVVCGVATALNWTFAFIITVSFSQFVSLIKGFGVYWLYSVFCGCSILMTIFFLPETKGKTNEEIEEFFAGKYPFMKYFR